VQRVLLTLLPEPGQDLVPLGEQQHSSLDLPGSDLRQHLDKFPLHLSRRSGAVPAGHREEAECKRVPRWSYPPVNPLQPEYPSPSVLPQEQDGGLTLAAGSCTISPFRSSISHGPPSRTFPGPPIPPPAFDLSGTADRYSRARNSGANGQQEENAH